MNTYKSPVRVIADRDFVIEPYKYYVREGESIFFWENDASSRDFIHLDYLGRILYSTLPYCPIFSKKANCSFKEAFRKMIFTSKEDHNHEILVNFFKEHSPVIIGGCGRSGTTLLTSMLGAHPNLNCIKEETFAFYPRPMRLRKLDLELPMGVKGRWVEKTPKNVRVFNDILKIMPKAKLIHVVRDGRAVVTSHHPNHITRYWVNKHRWFDDVTCGLLSPAYLVKYEDLILSPEKTLRGICDFIGEEFSPDMLEFYKKSDFRSDPSFGGHVKPLYTDSIHKWGVAEHKERVDEFLEDSDCSALMRILGYFP